MVLHVRLFSTVSFHMPFQITRWCFWKMTKQEGIMVSEQWSMHLLLGLTHFKLCPAFSQLTQLLNSVFFVTNNSLNLSLFFWISQITLGQLASDYQEFGQFWFGEITQSGPSHHSDRPVGKFYWSSEFRNFSNGRTRQTSKLKLCKIKSSLCHYESSSVCSLQD